MAVRIAIVDNNNESANRTADFIKEYAKSSGEIFKIAYFSDGDEISSDYKPIYDIIFMDIQLKRMDGMTAAEYIRKMDREVILIFLTQSVQYALRGYKVGALDYLIKPLTFSLLSQSLERAIEKLEKKTSDFLFLPIENGIVKMKTSRILFIESFKHKMLVITKDGTFTLTCTMRELEIKLKSNNFFRCNNGYLVNLAYVNRVKDNCVSVDTYELIISRHRRKAFLEALSEYSNGFGGF